MQICLLCSSATALFVGNLLTKDATLTLLCFSLNYSIFYLLWLWRSYRFAALKL